MSSPKMLAVPLVGSRSVDYTPGRDRDKKSAYRNRKIPRSKWNEGLCDAMLFWR